MSDGGGLRVEFTDILYGVVIANGIYGLEFGVTIENYLLVVALVVIIDDWIIYRIGITDVDATNRNYVVALVVDILVLTVWYLLTTVPVTAFEWYLALLVVFSLLQGLWDVAVLHLPWEELIRQPYLRTALAFAGLIVLYLTWDPPIWVVTTLAVVVFVLVKFPYWRSLPDQPIEFL